MAGLENWDQLTPRQRAVFFCCDGLKSNAKLASQKTQAIGICGQDIFDRYYLDNGNEARIKAAYDKRDPRLKQTIVTPYEPVDCFTAGLNGNENMIGKQLRRSTCKEPAAATSGSTSAPRPTTATASTCVSSRAN